jgi:SAM-dependent methyltransferase
MRNQDLVTYYRLRANEYDRVYEKPERQTDLRAIKVTLGEAAAHRHVLELAAGTGYWTPTISRAARSVVATDINPETLALARQREYGDANVEFRLADAFTPQLIAGDFDCVVAGFFMSHIPRDSVGSFLDAVSARVPTGRIVLFDNNYVDGSSTAIATHSPTGDAYQTRRLDNGETFDVLKNFYRVDELECLASAHSASYSIDYLDHYWFLVLDQD